MHLESFNNEFYFAGQIYPGDIAMLKEFGMQTIICNRPDGEDMGQPRFEEIKNRALAAGIGCYFLPISHATDFYALTKEFGLLLPIIKRPTLTYCRSGFRSYHLLCEALKEVSYG